MQNHSHTQTYPVISASWIDTTTILAVMYDVVMSAQPPRAASADDFLQDPFPHFANYVFASNAIIEPLNQMNAYCRQTAGVSQMDISVRAFGRS